MRAEDADTVGVIAVFVVGFMLGAGITGGIWANVSKFQREEAQRQELIELREYKQTVEGNTQ